MNFEYNFNSHEYPFSMHRIPTICNSPALSHIAKGWTYCIDKGVINTKGGYSLDTRLPALAVSTFNEKNERIVVGSMTYSVRVNSSNKYFIWIDFVYVNCIFRQLGLFKEMLKELEQIASEEYAEYIELGTNSKNSKMVKVCEKENFLTESITLRKTL